MGFLEVGKRIVNTLQANNSEIFNELNTVIQCEPVGFLDSELRGITASIGLEKGKFFVPSGLDKSVLRVALLLALLVGPNGGNMLAQDIQASEYNTRNLEDVLTTDSVRTHLGTFNYFDGFPDQESSQKAHRIVDFGWAVRAYLNFIPAASIEMMHVGHRDIYQLQASQGVGLFEGIMNSRTMWLTGNTDTVYVSAFLDLSNGPMVVEVPLETGPGTVHDVFFRFVVDMGGPGPDKGYGGNYLTLGPGEEAPANTDNYVIASSPSYIYRLILRGCLDSNGKPETANHIFAKRSDIG